MKILFYLGHPAHFHLFKKVIDLLQKKGHQTDIVIKSKDVLEKLLRSSGFNYTDITPNRKRVNGIGQFISLLNRDYSLFRHCLKNKPDLLVGTPIEIVHVSRLLRIPSIIFNEDDYNIVPISSKLGYPFVTNILSPISCKSGKRNSRWEQKTIHYSGFHELAYLHPNIFKPSIDALKKYIEIDRPYYIIRFAQLTAHHDRGKKGISTDIADELVKMLSKKGNVYITSERKLETKFEQYRISVPPEIVHHALANAKIYIGDSQTMAAEAAVLGTPSIRFNDFVGKIGYLEELEHSYGLTKGIKTSETELLFSTVNEYLQEPHLKDLFQERQRKMISEKISVTEFFVWFLENYPSSVSQMRKDPVKTQNNFKYS